MNVSGIRANSGLYTNVIKNNQNAINAAQNEEVEKISLDPVEGNGSENSVTVTRKKSPNQSFGAYDYANLYRPDQTFQLKGMDSDINSLDVQKAISDMQRDDLLHSYQTFVGESNASVGDTVTARGGEDFSL